MRQRRNLLAGVLAAAALAAPAAGAAPDAPPRILLVGDSTVSTVTGYGDALCSRLGGAVAQCLNLARGGRSSAGFRREGFWARVTTALKETGPWGATYVTVQFGHNDQPGRPGQSTDLATEFPANLSAYVAEIKQAGAHPILVTPLCRRRFVHGALEDTLEPWAEAVRKVGAQQDVPVIDLHAYCLKEIEQIGAAPAAALGPTPDPAKPDRIDYTHLGPSGADLFADYMAAQLRSRIPGLGAQR